MYRSVRIGALVVAALALPQSVHAAPSDGALAVVATAPVSNGMYLTKQATVTFGDLDLSGSVGAETLYARIDTAAQKLCGVRAGLPRSQADKVEKCRKQAVTRAVAGANLPTLSDVAKAK